MNSQVSKEPGRGGYSYQHLLLLSEPSSLTLTEIEKNLNDFFKTSDSAKVYFHNPKWLVADIGNGYCLHYMLNDSDDVQDESEEMADDYNGDNKEMIAQCEQRIECWGDEDNDDDYKEEFFSVLDLLVDRPGVFAYEIDQGIFYNEDQIIKQNPA